MGLLAEMLVRTYFELQQRPAYRRARAHQFRQTVRDVRNRRVCRARGSRRSRCHDGRAGASRPGRDGYHIDEAPIPRLSRPSPPRDRRHRRRRTSRCGTRTSRSASIFNGEIYNHVELRAELERRGHVFAAIIPTPKSWCTATRNGATACRRGSTACSPLRSTTGRRRLFLARDRFGEKPLYYAHRPGSFRLCQRADAPWPAIRIPTRSELRRRCRSSSPMAMIPAPNAFYAGAASCPAASV